MHLTRAEQRIFALLAHGYTQARIAAVLHCSPKTVQTHIAHLKDKLGVRKHNELIVVAAQHAVLKHPPAPEALSQAQGKLWPAWAEVPWKWRFMAMLDHLTHERGTP